jgi:hypothetical protein
LNCDLAWSYDEPLSDARDIAGCIAFLTERVDVVLDGERLPRAGHAVVIAPGWPGSRSP